MNFVEGKSPMSHYTVKIDERGNKYLEIDQCGSDLLHNPLLNKGTSFSELERHDFGLLGLLPPHISTMEEQLDRVYQNFKTKENNIEKYVYLRALQDRNETLFYALLSDHVDEMTPIIYTPTVGEAVQKGSHIFRYSRGLYISPASIETMGAMADSLPTRDIQIIVVTDNQGILGIGDQGIGGMGIPIGKLSLYTLGAGINPSSCLPICLDVGTDNEALLDDPLYLGHKHRRLTGEAYDGFIDRFVNKIKNIYPNAILQWEDFSKQNAFTNLDNFRDKILSFNDDIQGTGSVVLSGIIGSMKIIDEELIDQRYLVFGAGAGGVGVSRQIKSYLMMAGMTKEQARRVIYTVDSRGLITTERSKMEDYKHEFAMDPKVTEGWKVKDRSRISMEEVIKNAKITVLLGTSGQPGIFTEKICRAMTENCHSPLIFPLSNPTSKCEARPKDIYAWTDGMAIVATGSPFDDVELEGRTFRVGQGNNAFIFPGIGLGTVTSKAKIITDEMFTAGATRLADFLPADAKELKCVYPRMSLLRKVSEQVAIAVYQTAIKQHVIAQVLWGGAFAPPTVEGATSLELIEK